MKKKKKNSYFTKEHEDAIIKYSNSECRDERERLYCDTIGPVFDEMVDKIVYTYKFTNLPNIDSLREECKIWLTTILGKYDPSKGSKAFSYFSVVTKNWFIHKTKKNSKKFRSEMSYEELVENGSKDLRTIVYEGDDYYKKRTTQEFWVLLKNNLDLWDNNKLKENEKKVLDATKILLENVDELEIFNKKAIYLYLREITGLNTKQVVTNLKRIREKYKLFAQKYHEGEL
jgi:hypothetical protein